MKTTRISICGVLLASALAATGQASASTIAVQYQFTGSAHNLVIANGFITADGVASGSLTGFPSVVFDTHNHISLATLQNYGTFSMIFPNGSTVFGDLHEDDTSVSLATFSGPFTQSLMFTGGTGEFADLSGVLKGGGYIHPTFYTTSGAGALTAPGLVATPEPAPKVLLLIVFAAGYIGLRKRPSTPDKSSTEEP